MTQQFILWVIVGDCRCNTAKLAAATGRRRPEEALSIRIIFSCPGLLQRAPCSLGSCHLGISCSADSASVAAGYCRMLMVSWDAGGLWIRSAM
jgi:hypothetical protein